MTNAEIGRLGEKLAVRYLKKNGYRILDRNVHESHNELDIVALDKNEILFVEVNTRTLDDADQAVGIAASAVNRTKQKATIAAALKYLKYNVPKRYISRQPTMDVIEVYLDKESHKLIKIKLHQKPRSNPDFSP